MKMTNKFQDALVYAMISGNGNYHICENGTSFCKIKLITLYVKKKIKEFLIK